MKRVLLRRNHERIGDAKATDKFNIEIETQDYRAYRGRAVFINTLIYTKI